ncbi:MAG: hypothetical protein JWO95_1542 [Verrucomicrobiales bacterium]|nr:hypothetical protein [Verrucomicrobiales bacterium]
MPVDTHHPDYDASFPFWLRARDVLAGEDAVKVAGERYLPKLDSQTDEEFKAYRDRACFFNAAGRTLDGYSGLIFRRAPFVKVPEGGNAIASSLGQFVNDCDMLGTSLIGYAKDLVTEIIGVGRAGTLIDWEGEFENRAYVSLYQAEQIINWRVERVNGRNLPTLIVLKETTTTTALDGFDNDVGDQIRVLKLVRSASRTGQAEGGANANKPVFVYQVEIWQQTTASKSDGKAADWTLAEMRMPLRLGKPLPLIPFIFHGPRNSLPAVDKLPLSDLIAVNLDHYRLNAEYKHGMHFTALPTAWVSGFEKDSSLRIGSSTVWISETTGASAGFLEFTGDGLQTFERAMDRDEKLLAVLGSRLLEAHKRVGETAQAIELRQSGENSVLANVATSLSESLTQALRWVYWWNSTEETPEALADNVVLISLNTDFTTAGIDSNELREIVAAWQSGAISQDSMLELFRRGEVLPDGRSNEDEVALIKAGEKDKPQTAQPAAAAAAPINQPIAA